MLDIDISLLLIRIPPILLALTFHECAHGWMAMKCGDDTAYRLGRVTLNPLKHLDLMGSLAFLFSGIIGWAKPVPVNPLKFRNITRDDILVSMAGPAANILLAIAFAIFFKLMIVSGLANYLYNSPALHPLLQMVRMSIILNVILAVFNMIPIPPLDGSHVLRNLLPPRMAEQYNAIEPFGFVILILLIITDVLDLVLYPVLDLTYFLLSLGGM